jgi:nitric oxide reductase subunit B
MKQYQRLWWTLFGVLAITFSILGYFGHEVYRKAPPIPANFQSVSGEWLTTRDDILDGQTAWQSIGGMQLGSIWGHGAYQAPDWTADWLHRELMNWLNLAAQENFGQPYQELSDKQQNMLQYDLKREYRNNTYKAQNDTVVLSERRMKAIEQTAQYYDRLFGGDPALQQTREHYAMKEVTLPNQERRTQLTRFFFWTAWAAATEREAGGATYTNNWPHEPLIGNQPTAENIVWSIISVDS